jgi:hypothetical protein
MNRLATRQFRIVSVTRLLVAALLLVGIFASVLPLQTVWASPACLRACCAKRALHADGSCADGSCHASLRRKHRPVRHQSTSNGASEVCGLARKFEIENKTRPRIDVTTTKTETAGADVAVGKPCPPDCSGAAANLNSQRNSIAVSLPTHAGLIPLQRTSFLSTHALLSEVSIRDSAPRGPPLRLS